MKKIYNFRDKIGKSAPDLYEREYPIISSFLFFFDVDNEIEHIIINHKELDHGMDKKLVQ